MIPSAAGEDELRRHDGGEAAKHVAPTIDDNGLRRKAWHSGNNGKFISRNDHVETKDQLVATFNCVSFN